MINQPTNMMDNESILIAQVKALRDNLILAEQLLQENDSINAKLRKRVSICFQGKFKQQYDSLNNIQYVIEKNKLTRNSSDIGWQDFITNRDECRCLFNEYFAFLQGALVRSSGLDRGLYKFLHLGLCEIADALLEELSYYTDIHYPRFTILGEQECIVNATKIIRLRFPEFTIWNLPIIAHEFGHFINWRLSLELKELFKQIIGPENKLKGEKSSNNNHLQEQFADLVATYIIGPAFACTCIILNFRNDDIEATKETSTHPSYAQRSYLIIETLKLLDELDGQVYSIVIQELETISNYQAKLSDQEKQLLNRRKEKIFLFLEKTISPARYNRAKWTRAFTISRKLPIPEENSQDELVKLVKPDDKIYNVLNAAWRARLRCWGNSEQEKQINENALKLCQIIVDMQEESK